MSRRSPNSMIPRLRKAGIYVEKTQRPFSRGMRYRLYRRPDDTVAIIYHQSRPDMTAYTHNTLRQEKPK